MSFIVMSGDAFGSFTLAGPRMYTAIRDVTWQYGAHGLAAVTRFPQEDWARAAAAQVQGVNHAPEVFEVAD